MGAVSTSVSPFILRIRFPELTSTHQLAIPRNPFPKTPPSASPTLRRSSTSTSPPPAHRQTRPNLRGPRYSRCRRTIAHIKVSWLWHRWLWTCCGMVITPLIQSPIIGREINLRDGRFPRNGGQVGTRDRAALRTETYSFR